MCNSRFICIFTTLNTRIMKTQIAFIVTASVLLFACMAAKKTTSPSTPLYGTRWKLKTIQSGGGEQSVDTKAFIRFDEVKKSAGGNGSCNSFGSTIAVDGQQIHFSNVFSTKMYCEEVQKTENSFLGALEKISNYEIEGSQLVLKGDQVMLVFVAEQSPAGIN